MLTHPTILVWGAFYFEKLPKTWFRNVADLYSKARKKQTNGGRDLEYGLNIVGTVFSIVSMKGWIVSIIYANNCIMQPIVSMKWVKNDLNFANC